MQTKNETSAAAKPLQAKTAAAPATTTTNKPLDASSPVQPLVPDPTTERIGTGGVVELTSVAPEAPVARDATIIPTELEPGTQIPPTKGSAGKTLGGARAATAGTLGKPGAGEATTGTKTASTLGGSAESSAFTGQVVPTALALAGTIAAIFLAKQLVKRFGNRLGGGKRPSGVVEVLARYPFARGHHIVLIKVGRRVLVTHQSAQGITTLSEFTSQADVADLIARCEAGARGTEQFSFDSLLRNSDREFDAPGAADRRAQKAQRADQRNEQRSVLPASVRGAEIETIDLTRRRGVAR